jgi:hypothetical protein
VGYDLHVTRALQWTDSECYPISAVEIEGLVGRSPDLTWRGDSVDWLGGGSLRYRDGELSAREPPDGLVRRMLELAAALDAWVTGDDGEVYEWDGQAVRRRERADEELPPDPLYLARPDGDPIAADEWLAAAAAESDFRVGKRIQARLPSGTAWIPCPPVACWTGHPSGEPVWCFHDEDVVEVRSDDPDTVRRMAALAVRMGAEVLRWNGEPAR